MRFLVSIFVIACFLFGQSAKPEFEVASVKPSDPRPGPRSVSMKGGPGNGDPGRITFENVPLESLILTAYDIRNYQIAGPSWLIDNFGPTASRFDIAATMPPETTKEQFHLMLQNLLAERFKLTLHHEMKEMQVDELALAKNGPKLKPSPQTPPPTPAPSAPSKLTLGPDGYPVLAPDTSMAIMGSRARMRGTKETMERFAAWLSAQLNRPVTDATGLTGEYDFTLSWEYNEAAAAASGDPTLTEALQEQLGLKLESKKGQADVIVIDHIEKTPTEN